MPAAMPRATTNKWLCDAAAVEAGQKLGKSDENFTKTLVSIAWLVLITAVVNLHYGLHHRHYRSAEPRVDLAF